MPAFLTHWHVLIETARRSQDAGSDLGSLIIDASAMHRRTQGWVTPPQTTPTGAVWDTGPLPQIDFRFPGSDLSAMAYLGALAPDIPYYQGNNFQQKLADQHPQRQRYQLSATDSDVQWADWLHSNRSGDVLLAFLESIANVPSPALRSQALAFAMGYVSHIAADIALNPCINTLAGTYQRGEVAGVFNPLGMQAYVELCLDEYIASTRFNQPLYVWTKQPWRLYVEPAAQGISSEATLSARVLDLLTAAVEAIYELDEKQSKRFHLDYLAGLQELRRYLAGGGRFRFLTWRALTRKRKGDPIAAHIAKDVHEPGIVTFEAAMMYAIRLSERFCRRAIGYYAALRNTTASASERSQRRAALRTDLRNWNLETGLVLEATSDGKELHSLHNWVYFAELWESNNEAIAQAQASLSH